jgi:type IV pilus biogenesis protein CpaD/CtpE
MKTNPKLITISVLSSFIVLLLSGCATSPSVEEQTKVIEYEKCLELASITITEIRRTVEGLSDTPIEKFKGASNILSDFESFYSDNALERCKTYRP